MQAVLGAMKLGETPLKQPSKTKDGCQRSRWRRSASASVGRWTQAGLGRPEAAVRRPRAFERGSKMVKRQVVLASAKSGIVGCL